MKATASSKKFCHSCGREEEGGREEEVGGREEEGGRDGEKR